MRWIPIRTQRFHTAVSGLIRAAETYESCEFVKMDGEGHGWSEEAWPKAIEMVLDFFEKH